MPCGCNSNATSTGGPGWVYVAPSGQTTRYPSEVEAKAAKIRGGNVGTVRPA